MPPPPPPPPLISPPERHGFNKLPPSPGWQNVRSIGHFREANFQNLNMGLIDKVDMVCLSPVGYGA